MGGAECTAAVPGDIGVVSYLPDLSSAILHAVDSDRQASDLDVPASMSQEMSKKWKKSEDHGSATSEFGPDGYYPTMAWPMRSPDHLRRRFSAVGKQQPTDGERERSSNVGIWHTLCWLHVGQGEHALSLTCSLLATARQ